MILDLMVLVFFIKHLCPLISDTHNLAENNFQNFFQFQTAQELASRFCVYNINLPGQEMDAKPTADKYLHWKFQLSLCKLY